MKKQTTYNPILEEILSHGQDEVLRFLRLATSEYLASDFFCKLDEVTRKKHARLSVDLIEGTTKTIQ